MKDNNTNTEKTTFEKIKFSEPVTIIFGSLLAVLSGIICMQIMGKVGVSANTSILGAVFAMLIARIPMTIFSNFKSKERQNYIQTIVSVSYTHLARGCCGEQTQIVSTSNNSSLS